MKELLDNIKKIFSKKLTLAVVLVIVACFIGIRIRKAKDAKAALEKQETAPEEKQ